MADLSMRTSARETDATGASSRPITPVDVAAPADFAARRLAEIEAAWDAPTAEGLAEYREWVAA